MKTPGRPEKLPLEPLQRHSENLQDANQRLATMIAKLRQDRERIQARGQAAPTPVSPRSAPGATLDEQRLRADLERAQAELVRAREDEERMRERLEEIGELHRGVSDELVSLHQQIAHVAALHVALRRLHEAEDRAGVIAALRDIVVNIVGSEQLALVVRGPAGALAPVPDPGATTWTGTLDLRALAPVVERGEILMGAAAAAAVPGALACVPLRARGEATGALVLFGLLPQKPALGEDDVEVFELLQVHGALALQSAGGGGDAQV